MDELIHHPLAGEIYSYLSNDDRLQFCSTCQELRKLQQALEKQKSSFQVTSSLFRTHFRKNYADWGNLRELDLGSFATDAILMHLRPPLEILKMVGAVGITSHGLLEFSSRGNPLRPHELNYIDLTFCPNVSYAGTFPLRDAFSGLVIRRQPKWMDGWLVTPFGLDEVHHHWCDGSFDLHRNQHSRGYLAQIVQHDDSCATHIGYKFQFTSFVPPTDWPEWTRYAYRPGVSLRKIDSRPGEPRFVVAGQCITGLKAPQKYPKKCDVDLVPVNQSRFFNCDGILLDEMHDAEDRNVMVTHMSVIPFEKENLMPPVELVEEIRAFVATLPADFYLDRGETLLHEALVGT